MNLKEAFRYQNFLSSLMTSARAHIVMEDRCLKTTKRHLIRESNPDADDKEEVIACEDFVSNDTVLRFMKWIIDERYKLTCAIGLAKTKAGIDIDADIETNKIRQTACESIKRMLQYTTAKKTETGKAYKFNAEGNQSPYYYTIEVETTEAFDRDKAKDLMYEIIAESDKKSSEIDSALINTVVDYEPVYSVNLSYDDIVRKFAES
jgi:hypothetical protein